MLARTMGVSSCFFSLSKRYFSVPRAASFFHSAGRRRQVYTVVKSMFRSVSRAGFPISCKTFEEHGPSAWRPRAPRRCHRRGSRFCYAPSPRCASRFRSSARAPPSAPHAPPAQQCARRASRAAVSAAPASSCPRARASPRARTAPMPTNQRRVNARVCALLRYLCFVFV